MAFLSYFTNREKRKRLWGFIKVSAAHHPHCANYDKHVFTVMGVKVCQGCSVFYPTALISFILVWFVPSSFFEQSILKLTAIGFLFVIPSLLHASRIDKKFGIDRKISLLSRISFGMGIAYGIRYILAVPILFKVIAILGIISLYGLTMLVRYKTFWSECDGCPFLEDRLNFQHCPGLAPLNYFINPQVVRYFAVHNQLQLQNEEVEAGDDKTDIVVSK